jgi:hypothetical protein
LIAVILIILPPSLLERITDDKAEAYMCPESRYLNKNYEYPANFIALEWICKFHKMMFTERAMVRFIQSLNHDIKLERRMRETYPLRISHFQYHLIR